MLFICARRQEIITHGLGLILKCAKRDYMRVAILSRHIAFVGG